MEIDIPISDNIELWCTLYDYSSDESGVELIPRYLLLLIQSGVQQSYGLLTYRYSHLLITKLKFHERNPLFTGNLTINEHNDIRRIFNDNLDAYFQLCIELFDYMEDLLNLVQVIFTSLDQARTNSMTPNGQCRLNPIVICIQDSSLLYDYIVKVLFKLHDSKELYI